MVQKQPAWDCLCLSLLNSISKCVASYQLAWKAKSKYTHEIVESYFLVNKYENNETNLE